jgi:hypothetical protein
VLTWQEFDKYMGLLVRQHPQNIGNICCAMQMLTLPEQSTPHIDSG